MKKTHNMIICCLIAVCMAACMIMPAAAAQAQAGPSLEIVWPDMFGDQEGILTLDPEAQTWELDFENPYGAYHIAGTYQLDGTMECTDDAGMGTFLPLDAIFAAAKEAIAQLP